MENWKIIEDHPDYEVSDQGRVRRVTYSPGTYIGRIRKLQRWRGYHILFLNGKLCPIHRLVLGAFVGPLPLGMVTRHLNGNGEDNRLENLRYGTVQQNVMDSIRHGTHRSLTHLPTVPPNHKPNLGKKHSDETKARISQSLREYHGTDKT